MSWELGRHARKGQPRSQNSTHLPSARGGTFLLYGALQRELDAKLHGDPGAQRAPRPADLGPALPSGTHPTPERALAGIAALAAEPREVFRNTDHTSCERFSARMKDTEMPASTCGPCSVMRLGLRRSKRLVPGGASEAPEVFLFVGFWAVILRPAPLYPGWAFCCQRQLPETRYFLNKKAFPPL